jgi:hypothetical protein
MKRALCLGIIAVLCFPSAFAQQSSSVTSSTAVVPSLINFSGTLTDLNGKPLTGTVGVTFYLYKDEQGGAPLWLETQNVQPDRAGHYSVMLGSARSAGLPADIFAAGEARWLSIQPQGQKELPRVMLLSVPYALKAGDAQTIGGLPPSAFILAAPVNTAAATSADSTGAAPPPATITGSGTAGFLPDFTGAATIGNSAVFQSGASPTAKIGINTNAPTTTLDIHGGEVVRGVFTLPPTGTATAGAGKSSQPESFVASSFSSSTTTAVNQTFHWQAEPANNNTANPSATLNLLYGLGTATPTETGLRIGPKGIIAFAPGQTFPGTGTGTVHSVGLTAPASDFTVSGSPVTTTGTLNFAWNVAPTSADTANAIVKRDASGNFNAGTVFANLYGATASLSSSVFVDSAATYPGQFYSSAPGATSVLGSASASSGASWGVEGETFSNDGHSYGVAGFNQSTGSGPGVYGYTNGGGVGLYGAYVAPSTISSTFFPGFGGIWGDGGPQVDGGSYGVIGTIDAGIAGLFANSSGVDEALEALNYDTNGFSFVAFNMFHNAGCTINSVGDLNCTGAKNAIVPLDGGARKVAMSAIESPQNWFEDAGSAKLVSGSAVVVLDSDYTQTVNTEKEYQVFLTPYGDCKGLYVTNRTANSFEVHELGGGSASLSFGYRIMALRRKYESVRFADHTNDPDPKHQMEALASRRATRPKSPVTPKNSTPATLRAPVPIAHATVSK